MKIKKGFSLTDRCNCFSSRSIVLVSDAAGYTSSKCEYEIRIGAVGYVMPHSEMKDFFLCCTVLMAKGIYL